MAMKGYSTFPKSPRLEPCHQMSLMSYPGHLYSFFLPLCRDVVGIFYSPKQLGYKILLTYDLPKETVTIIMILNKDMKTIVCSPDVDTDFFDIITGILQGDTLASFLFMICLDEVLQMLIDTIKENVFILKKARSR